jgi:hypothetical protein
MLTPRISVYVPPSALFLEKALDFYEILTSYANMTFTNLKPESNWCLLPFLQDQEG